MPKICFSEFLLLFSIYEGCSESIKYNKCISYSYTKIQRSYFLKYVLTLHSFKSEAIMLKWNSGVLCFLELLDLMAI